MTLADEAARIAARHTGGKRLTARRCQSTIVGEPCGQPVYCRGLCRLHYLRRWRGADMDAAVRMRSRDPRCVESLDDGEPCGRQAVARGLCRWHYQRRRRAAS